MSGFFDKVAALAREGQSFAVATVVGRRAPVSARLGDRAIIFADGRMEGFVGGACSHEIVRRQALEVIGAKHGRLVSIRPDAAGGATADPEHIIVPMSCASEGAVDVYIEPFMAARRVVVVGATPVAEALAKSAVALGYQVVRVVDARETGDLEPRMAALGITVAPLTSLASALNRQGGDVDAIVASQGHYDEEALEAILGAGPTVSYVGLVASRKRGASVRAVLEERGVKELDRVRFPAGLDLGGDTAPEIAVSILAEMIQLRQQKAKQPVTPQTAHATPAAPQAATARLTLVASAAAVDPVCGMQVEISNARHTAEIDGTTYYFCCAQCRARFVKDPQPFLTTKA
jgi:xanthine dehydrogenase accessory factor